MDEKNTNFHFFQDVPCESAGLCYLPFSAIFYHEPVAFLTPSRRKGPTSAGGRMGLGYAARGLMEVGFVLDALI